MVINFFKNLGFLMLIIVSDIIKSWKSMVKLRLKSRQTSSIRAGLYFENTVVEIQIDSNCEYF
jgi:hypothetical protein